MELRPARLDEQEALARLFQRARSSWTFVPPVPDEVLPRIAADLFERHEEVWLAEEGGRPLGFLAIQRSRRDDWEVLEKLYVDPDAQNKGVGTALLDQAKALRPDGFVLWVFQRNEGARASTSGTGSVWSSSPTARRTWSESRTRFTGGALRRQVEKRPAKRRSLRVWSRRVRSTALRKRLLKTGPGQSGRLAGL